MDTALRHTLSDIGAYGPYFAIGVLDAPREAGWLPVRDFYEGTALASLVTTAAARLGTDDHRVAASIAHQGYAARLWSVVVAATVTGGRVPQFDASTLWWRTTETSLLELGTVESLTAAADDAALVASVVLDKHVGRFANAAMAETGVSSQVLAGNTASALLGMLRVLTGTAIETPARSYVRRLLLDSRLSDTGTADLGRRPPSFHRRSCCLFYRVPGGGLCGDCVLRKNGAPGTDTERG